MINKINKGLFRMENMTIFSRIRQTNNSFSLIRLRVIEQEMEVGVDGIRIGGKCEKCV
jgi:hypothetical protein